MKPKLFVRTRKAAVLLWGAASAATALTCAVLTVHDAFDHDPVVAWHLIVMGLAAFNLWGAATVLDRRTDTEVLHRLRLVRTPSSAADLARHLGRRPGPVRLSLLRLVRRGQAVQADIVSGVARYTVR
ncbi:hypothetical protein HUT16_17345 [Kitasatospora sp. NA04385]|uniref:hypothetical protein n=1 Tax=Kitasatospora sp. NA04385 TaxID=2742135 RepID=UPI0015908D63|nr:hypothetical protein [Kitasatospora sp. NA04385]QKW20598.1 hypothetical protein HUT16_17345 [Kitasatospora sp. NA04385]